LPTSALLPSDLPPKNWIKVKCKLWFIGAARWCRRSLSAHDDRAGHVPFKVETAGSNPAGVTSQPPMIPTTSRPFPGSRAPGAPPGERTQTDTFGHRNGNGRGNGFGAVWTGFPTGPRWRQPTHAGVARDLADVVLVYRSARMRVSREVTPRPCSRPRSRSVRKVLGPTDAGRLASSMVRRRRRNGVVGKAEGAGSQVSSSVWTVPTRLA
jgi:hypothetical protein